MWSWHSKWISEYSNKHAFNFSVSLNIPLQKLFRWFRRLQLWATGEWAAGDWQLHHNNAPAHASPAKARAESFGKISNHPGDSVPLQPRFGTLQLLAFPKTKVTFERGEISDHWWDSGKYMGKMMKTGRTVWGPKLPTLKEAEVSLIYVQWFLYHVHVPSSINVSIFHNPWLDTFWRDLIYR